MTSRTLAALLGLALAGCNSAQAVGTFTLATAADGFVVSRAPGDAPLLATFAGTGGWAPVSAGRGRARVEMQYGQFLFTEAPTPWRDGTRVRPAGQGRLELDDGEGAPVARVTLEAPSPGVLALRVEALDAEADRLALTFRCDPGDHFLGFGAQADALDHRGHKVPIWTSEPGIGKTDSDDPPEVWMLVGARHASSFGLPTWLSSRGFVGAVESDARLVFDLCKSNADAWRVEAWAKELTLWLYDGPAPLQALERATAGVLGRPPQPPPLAFAPWNDAIHGSAEVRRVAALLRDAGVPSSVLWTEDFRGGAEVPGQGYRLKEEWDLDRGLYPDAEALAAELRQSGFAWFAYFNTFLVHDTRVHAEARAGGHQVGAPDGGAYEFSGVTFKPTGLADLSRPATRDWVRGYLERALDVGFDGWMADYGEWLPYDAVLASGEPARLAHNRYPAEWAALNREALERRAADGRQRLFFSRAGWLGSTRDTPVVWAGDQRTSFDRDDGLYTVVPMGLGLGLGGVSTYGSDIAGYQSATNPPSTRELFFRWTSLGALTPVMRTHHGLDAKANWWFGADEGTLAHYRRWASFHLRLFPYLDGASVDAETKGTPLMRALALHYPDDTRAWTTSDQWLLGPSLLVAPVLDAGRTSRGVALPAGRWWPLFGGAALDGPSDVEVPAPLEEVPVFARAGALVPLLPDGVQSVLPAADALDVPEADGARVVYAFGGADGTFVERDGTRWTLALGAPDGVREAGAELPACAASGQRGCVEALPQGRRLVRLAGQGPLEVDGHRLAVEGPPRTVDVVWQPDVAP